VEGTDIAECKVAIIADAPKVMTEGAKSWPTSNHLETAGASRVRVDRQRVEVAGTWPWATATAIKEAGGRLPAGVAKVT
jgi:hypothetical protein